MKASSIDMLSRSPNLICRNADRFIRFEERIHHKQNHATFSKHCICTSKINDKKTASFVASKAFARKLWSKAERFLDASYFFWQFVETYPKLSDFKMTKGIQKEGFLNRRTLICHNFSNLSQIYMIQNIKMVYIDLSYLTFWIDVRSARANARATVCTRF